MKPHDSLAPLRGYLNHDVPVLQADACSYLLSRLRRSDSRYGFAAGILNTATPLGSGAGGMIRAFDELVRYHVFVSAL